MGPKYGLWPHMTPRNVYGPSNFKKGLEKKVYFIFEITQIWIEKSAKIYEYWKIANFQSNSYINHHIIL